MHSNLTALVLVQREDRKLISFSDTETNETLMLMYLSLYGETKPSKVKMPKHLIDAHKKVEAVFETTQWQAFMLTDPLSTKAEVFFKMLRAVVAVSTNAPLKRDLVRMVNVAQGRIFGYNREITLAGLIQLEQDRPLRQFGVESLNILEVLVLMAGFTGEMVFFTSYRKVLEKQK